VPIGVLNRSPTFGRRNRSWRKSVCHRQSGQLIRFEGYLLSEHDITRHQIAFGDETPSHLWIAGLIDLANVCRLPIVDAVSFAGIAADNIEKSLSVKLRALLLRQPTSQETPTTGFCGVAPADGPVKSKKRTRIRRAGRPPPKAY
jgi:hypothetical protein